MNLVLTKFQRQRGAAGNFQSRGGHSVLRMVISTSVQCYSLGDSVFRMNSDHPLTVFTGFLLHLKDKPILGYLVDSGFKEDVYEFFFQASTVVVDARENGNKDHASVSNMLWCLWLWAVAILVGGGRVGVGCLTCKNQASPEAKCKFADIFCC